MASPVPPLAPRLADALAAFREAGVEPTDAEIVWLAQLRRACDHPADGSLPWLIGAPFEYAGIKWYPLHMLASLWFQRMVDAFDKHPKRQIAVWLFAHARSAPGDKTVRDYADATSAAEMLDPWFNALPLHEKQLPELCARLRTLDEFGDGVAATRNRDAQSIATDPRAAIAVMCRAFPGTTPDFWLCDISIADARAYMSAANGGHSGSFADSEGRRAAIESWLLAVKQVWSNHADV